MRLKRDKQTKTERVQLRVSEEQLNRLAQKALLYTHGNLSELILYASLNFVPDKNDFEKKEKGGD